jgi:electron transfer flavoprotein beta subunit
MDLEIEDKKVTAKRALEDGYEIVETKMPCLITCIKELNQPRYPTVSRIMAACRDLKVEWKNAEDIKCEKDQIGLEGSPTGVKRTFAPEPKGLGKKLEGKTEEVVAQLIKHLEEDNIINR